MKLYLSLLLFELNEMIYETFYYLKEIFSFKRNKRFIGFEKLSEEQEKILKSISKYNLTYINKQSRACGVTTILFIDIINKIMTDDNYHVLFLDFYINSALYKRKLFCDLLHNAKKEGFKINIISEINNLVIVSYKNKRHYIKFGTYTNYEELYHSLRGVTHECDMAVYMDNMCGISERNIKSINSILTHCHKKYVLVADNVFLFPDEEIQGINIEYEKDKYEKIFNKIKYYKNIDTIIDIKGKIIK